MYQEGDMVSDDEDGGSDELSTPYASAHSSPARLQSSPEEEEADDDDKLLVDQRDTLLYGEVRASVPFNWEESPGKPKLKFSERIHNNNLQIVAAAAAANGLPQPTRRLSTEEYAGRWDPALQASPDQLQHLLPTPRHLLPLPPRLKAVKSNLQIAAAAAADSRVVVVQHRRTSSLDSLPRLHLYKPEAASSSSSSFPVQQQQQQGCGEEEKPKDFWRRLFKEKLLITRRKTVPKTSLGSAAAGPAGQLLLDAASSWESERAKKTTEEEAAAAAAARPANHHHHHRHQLLLLNGTDEKKWLQQQQQGNHSNVHHHSQQQHLSPSRSNSCRPQSVPQKPIPSIRSPAGITPRGTKATSPVTASGGEQRQQQQQEQQREIMFPYNIRLLTSCLGFPPIKTYRSSSSELRSLVYGSP